MARDPDAIAASLARLIEPRARGRLIARGLARGMIWRGGVVPAGGPEFSATLTHDLLDFGYGVLALALELRDANRTRERSAPFATQDAFRVAAEAIESAARRGDPGHLDQGRHLVVSAAAFHLAGYAARSYCLLPSPVLDGNLASTELALGLLLRGDLRSLRTHIARWLSAPQHTDDAVAARLANEEDEFGPDDVVAIALAAAYHRALGLAESALQLGERTLHDDSTAALAEVVSNAAEARNVPAWWVATLTLHLVRDLWDQSLHACLPPGPPPSWVKLRHDLIGLLAARNPSQIGLWPSQLTAAARSIDPTDDLVVALPTSAGKTRIAELCILRALADRKRTVYVTPLRALSAQVERVLARTFVPLGKTVTSLYGASGATLIDVQTLASADIVVATPEKLDFALRQDPAVLDDVALVVLDEGHMIGLGSREIRYEALIQRLLRRGDAAARRIVCLSAMFNPEDPFFQDFGNWLKHDDPREVVHVRWRPTRQRLATLDWSASSKAAWLSFTEGEKPFVPRLFEAKPATRSRDYDFPKDEVEFCIAAANAFAADGHSVLVYSPQRSQVESLVKAFCRIAKHGYLDAVAPPTPADLEFGLAVGREWLGPDHPAVRGLEIGVGTHHGALPRAFLSAVEDLLGRRLLPVVVASPTLAQGIDLSCGVLVFRSLERYDPKHERCVPIGSAEFANVVGRAGRAFVDLDGIAVLPTFDAAKRHRKHELFDELAKISREQRLVSGLARLVWEVAGRVRERLSVPSGRFLEYVLNQRDFWADVQLSASEEAEEGEEGETARTLDEYLADLDVALFSLVDPLDASVEDLASVLDGVMQDSLWNRTLAHMRQPEQQLEREVMLSRAQWLWRSTTDEQRKACFSAGLGKRAGVFLHTHLDDLVGLLADFHAAVSRDDAAAAGAAAASFAEVAMSEPFFSLRKVPDDWRTVLSDWVVGVAFADILKGRNVRSAQTVQAFVHDGIVFKLVWAAEAARAQAVTTGHARARELGDGPAFALTYGVPSIPAGLLCQTGLDSRVAALFATRTLVGTFTDADAMRAWLSEHDAQLTQRAFWESDDQYLLWQRSSRRAGTAYPRPWKRVRYDVSALWDMAPPKSGTRVRLLPAGGRNVTVCGLDLSPLGTATLPRSAGDAVTDARVTNGGKILVCYFGP